MLASNVVRFELPRGMRDVEPEEFADINHVLDNFLETSRLFNFRLMEPSPIEMLSTLETKGGTDISKEIYSFVDKGGRNIALRFDLTVGLARYVTSRRDLKFPVKLATFGGVWRYDEPQAGRYRYFHQWDIEIYGPYSQEADAEVIEFVFSFFSRLGLKVAMEINDRQLIEQYVKAHLGITNDATIGEVFRALDKVPRKGAQAVLQEYSARIEPAKLQSLVDFCSLRGSPDQIANKTGLDRMSAWSKLASLMDLLRARQVRDVRINLGIVRGLDYYSGMVFEAFDPGADGAALAGGGRYDRLTEALGRADTGATGVAGGIERIILALRRHGLAKSSTKPLVYVAYAVDDLKNMALEIASTLRANGIATDYDLIGKTLRKQLEDAASVDARVVVIVAAKEAKSKNVIVKRMKDGSEITHSVIGLAKGIEEMLKA